MRTNRSIPNVTVIPELAYADVAAAADWLTRAFERAKAAGASIMQEPTTHPYGERQYAVEDIGGHRWKFSESVVDVAPEEWGGTSVNL